MLYWFSTMCWVTEFRIGPLGYVLWWLFLLLIFRTSSQNKWIFLVKIKMYLLPAVNIWKIDIHLMFKAHTNIHFQFKYSILQTFTVNIFKIFFFRNDYYLLLFTENNISLVIPIYSIELPCHERSMLYALQSDFFLNKGIICVRDKIVY